MAATEAKRETTREKGKRLHGAGCVEKVGEGRYEVEGASGKYLVERRGTFLHCGCKSTKGDCSHVEAVHCAIDEEMRAAEPEEQEEVAFGDFSALLSLDVDDDDIDDDDDDEEELFVL